ncbi:nucleotide exchange factor GrpE [Streptomyces sp. NPDC058525]|uniref:nucleotide exchange factor GrpE n=1 Tax=Streptomyces sp. NPDC058525 TaxID=3346538 RepID=UPI00365CC60F
MAADLLAVADRLTNRELARRIRAVVARLPGIATISPEPGSPFDPAAHNWAETHEATEPLQCGRIAAVLDPGFRESHTRKVLKPARVAVYDMEEESHD